MTLDELRAVQKAAHAEWVKAPTKANEAALSAACRAVAAAKKAAAPAAVVVDSAAIDEAINAAKRAEQERQKLADLKRAYALYEQAHEYPRCGQSWPMTPAEKAADKLLQQAGAHK